MATEMTIIYTETHLTSDPEFYQDSAIFQIALSTITFYCHIHREENIEYIKTNRIRTGDIIRLYGVLITEPKQYIKISSLALITFSKPGKKRKMDEILTDPFVWFAENEERSMPTKSLTPMSMSPLDATCTLKKFEHYIEFSGSFYHYFFFLYGQAQFVCLHVTQNTNECHKSNVKHELEVCQQQNARELNGLITDIYQTATEVAKRGLSKLFVLSFVNKATLFIDKINDLLKTCDVPVPEGLEIDQRVPLPSDIYHFYIWNCS